MHINVFIEMYTIHFFLSSFAWYKGSFSTENGPMGASFVWTPALYHLGLSQVGLGLLYFFLDRLEPRSRAPRAAPGSFNPYWARTQVLVGLAPICQMAAPSTAQR